MQGDDKSESRHTALAKVKVWQWVALAFGLWTLNRGMLALFGEDSPYRAEHSLIGLVFLALYTLTLTRRVSIQDALRFFGLAVIPCYLGTVLPDLDISLLGIGGHRNPIFHGCFAYIALWAVIGRRSQLANRLVRGFGIGLASHLLWDAWDYGDVRWISGGTKDRLWLITNGLVCLAPLPMQKHRHTP